MADDKPKEFRLKKAGDKRIITWPVNVPVPQDGGIVDLQTLNVRYQLMTSDEETKLIGEEAAEMIGQTKPGVGTPLLRAVVKGFVGFRDDDSGEIMPDEDAIPLLLGTIYVALALRQGYFDMKAGRARKNS